MRIQQDNRYHIPAAIPSNLLDFADMINEDDTLNDEQSCNEDEVSIHNVVGALLNKLCAKVEHTVSSQYTLHQNNSLKRKSVITSAASNKAAQFNYDNKLSYNDDDDYGEEEDGDDSDDSDEDEEEDDDVEITKEQQSTKSSSKQKKSGRPKRKRKRKNPNQRRNIRNIFKDNQLGSKTQLLRERENERLKRLGIDIPTLPPVIKPTALHQKKTTIPCNLSKTSSKPPVVISLLDSDSDDEPVKKTVTTTSSTKKKATEVLILSSDSDDDVRSDSEVVLDKKVQTDDYYSELGLHTNDALNISDNDGRILANVNHGPKDQDIFIPSSIAKNLKPHQIGGVRFLYDNLIESVNAFRPNEGNGCLLAHAMGLGKTIQTITFIDLFLRYTPSKKVLCVVPVNTIQNWMNEFNRWLPEKPVIQTECLAVKPKTFKQTRKDKIEENIIKRLIEDMVEFVAFNSNQQGMNEERLTDNMAPEDQTIEQKIDMSHTDIVDSQNTFVNNVCMSKTNVRLKDNIKNESEDPTNWENKNNAESSDDFRNFKVFLVDAGKTPIGRAKIIDEWDRIGGVLLIGYEMYRMCSLYSNQKPKSKTKKGKVCVDEDVDVLSRLKKAICRPGPDLVVCDEGHRIRNYQSGISRSLKSIKTRKRLVLTGYPLQNNLIEYWCMVDFVRPNYLGSRQEFANMFERPIMNGQCFDSTKKDKHIMKQRAHVLYSLLQGFVQRRGHDVLKKVLPHKEEHVLMICLSHVQKALYKRLIELTKEAYNDSLNPIKTFCLCCKIWNHPDILYKAIRASQQGKQMDIISDEDDISLDDSNQRQKRRKKRPQSQCASPVTPCMSNIGYDPFGTEARTVLEDLSAWADPVFKDFPYTLGDITNSGKFVVLKQLIDESMEREDKMLIFSQSLLTLNTIEEMLQKTKLPTNLSKNTNPSNDTSSWKKGRDYFRLDGSTVSVEREKLINLFNANANTKIFLLSTRAGCLGINLVGANRVVVFDVSWNPCHDAQAVCRIYRYGQTKPCYIYRLVSSNTMEKKIYYRQISKQGISDRVVDEINLTEKFSKSELQSLIAEAWVDENEIDLTKSCEKVHDEVLRGTMKACSRWITEEPFKHESLLINESEQKLSGCEKREAKRAYEEERLMTQGSHVPFRTYPLQQNFPRNTPVAPVRPFLWRPPDIQQSSWLHMTGNLTPPFVANNATIPPLQSLTRQSSLLALNNSNIPSSRSSSTPDDLLHLLEQAGYDNTSSFTDILDSELFPLSTTSTNDVVSTNPTQSQLTTSIRSVLSRPINANVLRHNLALPNILMGVSSSTNMSSSNNVTLSNNTTSSNDIILSNNMASFNNSQSANSLPNLNSFERMNVATTTISSRAIFSTIASNVEASMSKNISDYRGTAMSSSFLSNINNGAKTNSQSFEEHSYHDNGDSLASFLDQFTDHGGSTDTYESDDEQSSDAMTHSRQSSFSSLSAAVATGNNVIILDDDDDDDYMINTLS